MLTSQARAPTPVASSCGALSSPAPTLASPFAELMRRTVALSSRTRRNLVIPGLLTLGEGGVREDDGAAARADLRRRLLIRDAVEDVDGAFVDDRYEAELLPVGKYHKFNTQYVGTRDALSRYATFVRDAPEFVDDAAVAAFFAGGRGYHVHVANGIVGSFGACLTCGKLSNVPACHDCKMKACRTCVMCAVADDVRRMVRVGDDYRCFQCHNGELIDCARCGKTVPRGHPCVPPGRLATDIASTVGRPRTLKPQRYVPLGKVNGKFLCPHGCPPGTLIGLNSWRRHLRRKHPHVLGLGKVPLFRCKKVGCTYRGCNDKSQFARHMLTHSKSRAFVCRFCKKSYKQSEGLSAHYAHKHPVQYAKFKKQHYRHAADTPEEPDFVAQLWSV